MAQIDAFFSALPSQLPAQSLDDFDGLVAPDVIVMRDNEQVHDNRESWFSELRTNPFQGWTSPKPPAGASVGRDQFYRSSDGDITVRELITATPPDGENVRYYTAYSVRFVAYTLSDGILTKGDYGEGLDTMAAPKPYRDQ